MLVLAALVAWLWPVGAFAVTTEDFLVTNTQDLVDICSTAQDDPLYPEAIAFCHGFVVGAYQYHVALFGVGKSHSVVCLTDPKPTRVQAIERFLAWTKAHPEYGKEKPAESLTKFMVETWPCPQQAAVKSKKKSK
jgi:hypothetical protein